jgi:hypothetical protein
LMAMNLSFDRQIQTFTGVPPHGIPFYYVSACFGIRV